MGAPDRLPATTSAPIPHLMRELQFFLTLEKRVVSAREAEEAAGVFVCSAYLAELDDICMSAQAAIGRALALAYVEEASHA